MEASVCGNMKLRDSGQRVSKNKEGWIVVVITIFTIAIAVALILFIALYVYANKHRQEKRNSLLNRSLTDQEKNQSLV